MVEPSIIASRCRHVISARKVFVGRKEACVRAFFVARSRHGKRDLGSEDMYLLKITYNKVRSKLTRLGAYIKAARGFSLSRVYSSGNEVDGESAFISVPGVEYVIGRSNSFAVVKNKLL